MNRCPILETNRNQRDQFIASFKRVKGRKPSPSELAAFDARHLERGFIANNFSSGFYPIPSAESEGASEHTASSNLMTQAP